MNRNEKQHVIESIKSDFEKNAASFLVGVQGLTVADVQKLRKNLFHKGGQLKVAKNTLLKRATHDMAGLSELAPYFKDQIAIVFAGDQTTDIAKLIAQTAKENERLKIIVGALNKKVISKAQVESLASLPSKEVLLSQLCGTLQAPIASLASVLNQFITRLVWVLKKVEEKKQA